jgi:ABC-type glycerol-3-phosphate transport system substrate-binding protein
MKKVFAILLVFAVAATFANGKAKSKKDEASPSDTKMKLEAVDVTGWIDDPSSVFVLEMRQADFEGITITRNFNDFLVNTLDREQTEMRNQEN